MSQADAIIAEARRWIGVRFHHQGRSRAGGVDCLGLLVVVADHCGLCSRGTPLAQYDRTDYGKRPDTLRLQSGLEQLLAPQGKEAMRPGDVGLFYVAGRAQHLAILSDYPVAGELGMIHAYAPARKVIEHRMDAHWWGQLAQGYRIVSSDTLSPSSFG